MWKVTITVDDNLLSMLLCGDKFHSPPKMELPFNNEFQIGDLKCYHLLLLLVVLAFAHFSITSVWIVKWMFGGLLFALKDDALSLHLLFLQSKPVLQWLKLFVIVMLVSLYSKRRGLWSRDIFICQDTKDWLFTLDTGCLITL